MSRDGYHEMFLHMVWHTKDSRNTICPDMEPELYAFLRQRALQPGGVYVFEVGGTRNHVHLVCRITPILTVSQWIGQIKGGSSYDINHTDRWRNGLDWQDGYGAVSFGAKDLQWVVAYVKNQKQHHDAGTIFDRLERIWASQGSEQAVAGGSEG